MSEVHVGVEGRGLLGSLGFRDALRPDAADVVRRLRDMSVRVALLSGDNAVVVSAVARQAGIQVRAALGAPPPMLPLDSLARFCALVTFAGL
jgi:P-type E1-E2 ATPase